MSFYGKFKWKKWGTSLTDTKVETTVAAADITSAPVDTEIEKSGARYKKNAKGSWDKIAATASTIDIAASNGIAENVNTNFGTSGTFTVTPGSGARTFSSVLQQTGDRIINFSDVVSGYSTSSAETNTFSFIMKTGATAYGISDVQIGSTSQPIKWAGGAVPVPVANAVNIYTITIYFNQDSPDASETMILANMESFS